MTAARDEGGQGVRDPEIVRAEADIARTREAVTRKVMALQQEISRTFEWSEWIRQRPLLAVVLAFGAGALLGSWRPNFHHRRR
jgi:hypothetical protein